MPNIGRFMAVVSLYSTDEDGRSLLHNAVTGRNVELIQLILSTAGVKGKALVQQGDEEGWTPLHTASSAGDVASTKLLLAVGADAKAQTSSGLTALHYAASKGHKQVAELLLSSGANAKAVDKHSTTPLHRAAGTGQLAIAQLLVEGGEVPVDPKDATGSTPLLLAVQRGAQALVLYLVSKGADVQAADADGLTPLQAAEATPKLQQSMLAVAKGELEIEDLL